MVTSNKITILSPALPVISQSYFFLHHESSTWIYSTGSRKVHLLLWWLKTISSGRTFWAFSSITSAPFCRSFRIVSWACSAGQLAITWCSRVFTVMASLRLIELEGRWMTNFSNSLISFMSSAISTAETVLNSALVGSAPKHWLFTWKGYAWYNEMSKKAQFKKQTYIFYGSLLDTYIIHGGCLHFLILRFCQYFVS